MTPPGGVRKGGVTICVTPGVPNGQSVAVADACNR